MGKEAFLDRYGSETLPNELAEKLVGDLYNELREAYGKISKEPKKSLCLLDLEEAVRQGLQGPVRDWLNESKVWDFKLEKLSSVGRIIFYHGTSDKQVPFKYGKALVSLVENSVADSEHTKEIVKHFIEGESHTLFRRYWDQILEEVVSFHEPKLQSMESKF